MKKYLFIPVVLVIASVIAVILWPHHADHRAIPPIYMGSYQAFGDSVAAGVGLADYSDSSACDRTKQAYPNTVAANMHYKLMSVACSGATTKAGLIGSQDVNNLSVAPQIDSLQATAKPKLITLTIGANDAMWTSYIAKCYTAVCGSDDDTATITALSATTTANIRQALQHVKDLYPQQPPRVAITGYYHLFPADPKTNCTEITGIDQSELAWIAQLQATIEASLQAATQGYTFASYIPISFAGHELCTSDSWIQGISAKAPYHPTDAGQKAIAQQIVASIMKAKQ